jgi:hypothetical protein
MTGGREVRPKRADDGPKEGPSVLSMREREKGVSLEEDTPALLGGPLEREVPSSNRNTPGLHIFLSGCYVDI